MMNIKTFYLNSLVEVAAVSDPALLQSQAQDGTGFEVGLDPDSVADCQGRRVAGVLHQQGQRSGTRTEDSHPIDLLLEWVCWNEIVKMGRSCSTVVEFTT